MHREDAFCSESALPVDVHASGGGGNNLWRNIEEELPVIFYLWAGVVMTLDGARRLFQAQHLVQLLAFEAASSELALSSALGQLVASMAGTYAWPWPLPAICTPKPATDRYDRSPQRAQWWRRLRSAARRVGAASAAAYAHW